MGDPFVRPGLEYQPHIEEVMLRNEGTMSSETSKEEWFRAQHRDTIGFFLHRNDELMHLAVLENVSVERMRRTMLERLANPLAVTTNMKRGREEEEGASNGTAEGGGGGILHAPPPSMPS